MTAKASGRMSSRVSSTTSSSSFSSPEMSIDRRSRSKASSECRFCSRSSSICPCSSSVASDMRCLNSGVLAWSSSSEREENPSASSLISSMRGWSFFASRLWREPRSVFRADFSMEQHLEDRKPGFRAGRIILGSRPEDHPPRPMDLSPAPRCWGRGAGSTLPARFLRRPNAASTLCLKGLSHSASCENSSVYARARDELRAPDRWLRADRVGGECRRRAAATGRRGAAADLARAGHVG